MSKTRDWADLSDDPDYEQQLVFNELESETRASKTAPPTRLVEVSEETAAFLCSKRPETTDRLKTRNAYALPKVSATRQQFLMPEVPKM